MEDNADASLDLLELDLCDAAFAKRQASGRRVRGDFVVWRMLYAAGRLYWGLGGVIMNVTSLRDHENT